MVGSAYKFDRWEGVLSFRVVRGDQPRWQRTVPEGSGRFTLGSGASDGPYSLPARVEPHRAAAPLAQLRCARRRDYCALKYP
jgi:hypothetical protein